MADNDDRVQQWLDRPYTPEMGSSVDAQERAAKSSEYTAYQTYQINQKLDGLINAIGALADQMPKKSKMG